MGWEMSVKGSGSEEIFMAAEQVMRMNDTVGEHCHLKSFLKWRR